MFFECERYHTVLGAFVFSAVDVLLLSFPPIFGLLVRVLSRPWEKMMALFGQAGLHTSQLVFFSRFPPACFALLPLTPCSPLASSSFLEKGLRPFFPLSP